MTPYRPRPPGAGASGCRLSHVQYLRPARWLFIPHCLEEGRTVGWLRGVGGVGSTRRKGQVPREVLSPGQRQLRLSLKRAALAARLEEKRPTWAGGLWSPPPERTALPPGSEGGERATWSHACARVCHAFRFFARQGLFPTSCVKVPPARNTGRVLFEDGAMIHRIGMWVLGGRHAGGG